MCEYTSPYVKQNVLRSFTLPAEIKLNNNEETSPRKTPLNKRLPVLRKSRENRNNFTLQQTLCVCLLSPFCKVSVHKPTRRSSVTEQFFRISSLQFPDGTSIDVASFLKARCDTMYYSDLKSGVSDKTATRRYQNNKKIEMIHFLSDLLFMCGYEVNSSCKGGKIGMNVLEGINSVQWGQCVIVYDNIIPKLIEANHMLLKSTIDSENDYVVDSTVFNGNFFYKC
ncbi:hypothetical protein EIN_411200 [Entamoeba invadens IP1]|uniref:Uncharacterized protein n=1 Tax=Entamoeba invadens IP1 TaxID=370355 RepID=A0A0A1U142_ENTIV|nr:hypothetical protein EIN_411200 [Entamoeba invadens IP1]ELP87767.1 hypothetical protein EIN_411200 [Entamoeba invadens IP1]|eukprot:XP_004254538.1 hypothetical protein EIN_411200 [Entamoeba invadens IP1]